MQNNDNSQSNIKTPRHVSNNNPNDNNTNVEMESRILFSEEENENLPQPIAQQQSEELMQIDTVPILDQNQQVDHKEQESILWQLQNEVDAAEVYRKELADQLLEQIEDDDGSLEETDLVEEIQFDQLKTFQTTPSKKVIGTDKVKMIGRKFLQCELYDILVQGHDKDFDDQLIVPDDFDFGMYMSVAIQIGNQASKHPSLDHEQQKNVEQFHNYLKQIRDKKYHGREVKALKRAAAFNMTKSIYTVSKSYNYFRQGKLTDPVQPFYTKELTVIRPALQNFYKGFKYYADKDISDAFLDKLALYVHQYIDSLEKREGSEMDEKDYLKFAKYFTTQINKDGKIQNIVRQFIAAAQECIICNQIQLGVYAYSSHQKKHIQKKVSSNTYVKELNEFALQTGIWSLFQDGKYHCCICEYSHDSRKELFAHLSKHDDNDLSKLGFLQILNRVKQEQLVIARIQEVQEFQAPNEVVQATDGQEMNVNQPEKIIAPTIEEQGSSVSDLIDFDFDAYHHTDKPRIPDGESINQQQEQTESIQLQKWQENPFYKAFVEGKTRIKNENYENESVLEKYYCFVHEIKLCLQERKESRHMILGESEDILSPNTADEYGEHVIKEFIALKEMQKHHKDLFPDLQYFIFVIELWNYPILVRLDIKSQKFVIFDPMDGSTHHEMLETFILALAYKIGMYQNASCQYIKLPKVDSTDDLQLVTIYNLLCLTGFRSVKVKETLGIEKASHRWLLHQLDHREDILKGVQIMMQNFYLENQNVLEFVYGAANISKEAQITNLLLYQRNSFQQKPLDPQRAPRISLYTTHRNQQILQANDGLGAQLNESQKTISEVDAEMEESKSKSQFTQLEIDEDTSSEEEDPLRIAKIGINKLKNKRFFEVAPGEDRKYVCINTTKRTNKGILPILAPVKKIDHQNVKKVIKEDGKTLSIFCIPSPRDLPFILKNLALKIQSEMRHRLSDVKTPDNLDNLFESSLDALSFFNSQSKRIKESLLLCVTMDQQHQNQPFMIRNALSGVADKNFAFVFVAVLHIANEEEARFRFDVEVLRKRAYLLSFLIFNMTNNQVQSCSFHNTRRQDKKIITEMANQTGRSNFLYHRYVFESSPFDGRGMDYWPEANSYIMWLLLLGMQYHNIPQVTTYELIDSKAYIKELFSYLQICLKNDTRSDKISMENVLKLYLRTEDSMVSTHFEALDRV